MRFQCPIIGCLSTFEGEEKLKQHLGKEDIELYKCLYEGIDEGIDEDIDEIEDEDKDEDEDDRVPAKGRNPVMRKHPQSCALAAALFSLLLLHQVKNFLDLPQHII